MKTALRVYGALLRLYPASYRQAFGAEMLQTFSDHYSEIRESRRGVGHGFWVSTVLDEIENIARQNVASLTEGNDFLRISWTKGILSALLLLPFYFACYLVVVTLSLAVPHPAVNGVLAILALATVLVIVPGMLSLVSSYLVACSIVKVFHRKRIASV